MDPEENMEYAELLKKYNELAKKYNDVCYENYLLVGRIEPIEKKIIEVKEHLMELNKLT